MTLQAATNRNRQVGSAWLLLCGALALHVADEALTGFLAVYNPIVASIRSEIPWLPLPVFRFDVWLTGLAIAVAVLSLLSPAIARGHRWTRPAGYVFAIFMIVNALGHTAGTLAGQTVSSVHFTRPMPGFYSSPLLLGASILLLARLRSASRFIA